MLTELGGGAKRKKIPTLQSNRCEQVLPQYPVKIGI
jgi:hypothetical protein